MSKALNRNDIVKEPLGQTHGSGPRLYRYSRNSSDSRRRSRKWVFFLRNVAITASDMLNNCRQYAMYQGDPPKMVQGRLHVLQMAWTLFGIEQLFLALRPARAVPHVKERLRDCSSAARAAGALGIWGLLGPIGALWGQQLAALTHAGSFPLPFP